MRTPIIRSASAPPAPILSEAQLAAFSLTAIRATPSGFFDPAGVSARVGALGSDTVTAVDIGGDKIVSARYAGSGGELRRCDAPRLLHASAGAGYLELLRGVSSDAEAAGSPLGISYAGPVQDGKALAGMNLAVFFDEFRAVYGGDFTRLNPRTTLVNDGQAGLLAAALEAVRRYPGLRHVILVINGSGLNCAVLKDGTVFAAEAGHVPVQPDLNPFGQRKPCGMLGAEHVCVENVGASVAGIEDLWYQSVGLRSSGREIAGALADGDDFAARLYENSALVTAHVVLGVARAFDLVGDWASTAVVGHGGTFRVPGFRERVGDILDMGAEARTQFFVTTDFTDNACLDGAAIAAACAEAPRPERRP
jgi:predicted NBD/HSP70 family sugar kinase